MNILLKNAAADGIHMILTCDNGIAAIDQIAEAKKLGMTVVVTDHHDIQADEVLRRGDRASCGCHCQS